MEDVFIISHLFCKIPKTPDVVCVNEDLRYFLILKMVCVFECVWRSMDLYVDDAFSDKLIKSNSLVCKCRLVIQAMAKFIS